MIACLGVNILPYLPPSIQMLMVNCDNASLIEFVLLINQIISTFKEKVRDISDKLLLPLVQRIMQSVTGGDVTPKSEEEREKLMLRKTYFVFIQNLASHQLVDVLASEVNVSHLKDILMSLIEGCYFFKDVTIQKLAFSTLKFIISSWGSNPSKIAGFTEFIFNDVSKALYSVPLNPNFNLNDVAYNTIIVDIIHNQKTIIEKYGTPYLEYLASTVLPSLHCDSATISLYLTAFQKEDRNSLKTFLRGFILNKR
eukprot:TRINITY_DN2533_c0_g1_i3.p1 TRINITY_DN2533_c0_g1~~TRINITY_DN2533_c0_g1_i3.p1  ORF type:complete len:254 (-),score=33.94 TRINITY_DN2533_c0_g1_i3:70-831(-)